MTKIRDRDAVAHGTFYFVHLEDDFAVAAIDSRANYPGSHRDDAIKIAPLDAYTIFLCQGISIGEGFNATEVAKKIFAQHVAPVDPYELASSWATEMRTHIEMLWKTDPALVNGMRPDAASGVFLGHADTRGVVGAVAQIQQETPSVFKKIVNRMQSGDDISTGGHEEIIQEVNAYSSDRSIILRSKFADPGNNRPTFLATMARMYVTAVRDWTGDNEIGGEIAAIILERGRKYRWLH
jgi:hypothetical protein